MTKNKNGKMTWKRKESEQAIDLECDPITDLDYDKVNEKDEDKADDFEIGKDCDHRRRPRK